MITHTIGVKFTGIQLDFFLNKLDNELPPVAHTVKVIEKDKKYELTFKTELKTLISIAIIYGKIRSDFDIEDERHMYNPKKIEMHKGKMQYEQKYKKGNWLDPMKLEHIIQRGATVETISDTLLTNGATKTTVNVYWVKQD